MTEFSGIPAYTPFVALELLAHAWHTRQALPPLTDVWPMVPVAEAPIAALPLYALAAQAINEGTTAAAFFHGVDVWLAERDQKTWPLAACKAVAADFLEQLLATRPTEAAAQAALQRALELAKRVQLEGLAHAALQQGPSVSANTLALQLRNGVDAALRSEGVEGPLSRHRDTLFNGLARTVGGDAVPIPFPSLNGLLHGGFKSGRLYVLVAPPKAGKTTFAAVVMDYAAAAGHPVLYLGYEMSREQLVEYALARNCQINSSQIETRDLGIPDAERVAAALDAYLAREGQWLELWEAGLTTTLADAAAWALQAKARQPDQAPLIVVDYLQLARVGIKEVDSHQSETKRVSEVAVACKDLARKTGAAVLALSSVTKEAERQSREQGELDVTAARDSLAIVHTADGILTLQTATIDISVGKGEHKTTTSVDPWRYLEQDLRKLGRESEAVNLSRALDKLDKTYPQRWLNGPDFGVRARLSLVRHRGRTGEVALYYRRGFHALEEVALPGLGPRSPANLGAEQAIRVFQQYIATTPTQMLMAVPAPIVATTPAAEPTVAEPPLPPALAELEYRYLTELAAARTAIADLSGQVGLDFETTGLCPIQSQPRLLSLYDGKGPVLVIDLFRIGGLHRLREQLEPLQAVAHNAVFDMKFLHHHGQVAINLDCTLLAQHLIAVGQGGGLKLQDLAQLYLGLELDKAEQKSDWGADLLTEEQLRYAALDALVVQQIFPRQLALLETLDSLPAYALTRAAQPAVVSMELAGMAFDTAAQETLMTGLAADKARLEQVLSEALQGGNPSSAKQLSDWLIGQLGGPGTEKYAAWPKTGQGQLKTGQDDLHNGLLMLPEAAAHIIREALLPYKDITKKLSAFGTSLADKINPLTGRIHAHYKLAGTVTGRMSCSQPNLQQIPKDKTFRALFAAPPDRIWVIADYTQMELRCAAHIAGEETLLQAYRDGQDTHALTAAMLLGLSAEQWTALTDAQKAEKRQLAKAVNFGLLYGQGAKGLQGYAQSSYGVTLSEDQARQHRNAWFAAYPAFSRWQTRSGQAARRSLEVRTPAGRVRRWEKEADFKETCAYNTPVQGAGAEVLLAALAELHDRLTGLDATPLAVIHDEIIVECAPGLGEQVKAVLEESMVAGMLAIFPEASTIGLVEAHLADSWAGKGGKPAA